MQHKLKLARSCLSQHTGSFMLPIVAKNTVRGINRMTIYLYFLTISNAEKRSFPLDRDRLGKG